MSGTPLVVKLGIRHIDMKARHFTLGVIVIAIWVEGTTARRVHEQSPLRLTLVVVIAVSGLLHN